MQSEVVDGAGRQRLQRCRPSLKLEGEALCPEGEEFGRFEEGEKSEEDGESYYRSAPEEEIRDGVTAG